MSFVSHKLNYPIKFLNGIQVHRQVQKKKMFFFAKNADRPNAKVNLPNIFYITIAGKKIIKF